MKIIFFGGIGKATDQMEFADIKGTSYLYSYYLRKEFERRGIETDFALAAGSKESDICYQGNYCIPEGDHILSVEQRGWLNRKDCPTLFEKVRKSIKGKVCTICDNSNTIGPEDLLFYAVPAPSKPKAVYVGWAADHTLCYPDKTLGEIRILIDHSYYGKSKQDFSVQMIDEVFRFARAYEGRVVVRRFVTGGVETMDIRKPPRYEIYRRMGLPYLGACEEYRKADIFVVTHRGTMELSVLESAMSGAFVIAPNLFISRGLIDPLHHIKLPHSKLSIPWSRVLGMLDVKKSVMQAKANTWERLVDRMLEALLA